jgi:7,8-dihydropterin-6-yl-methyl-4-(beta-D-ribofuranosyl)aminobenzene 5'-phosphate synthase
MKITIIYDNEVYTEGLEADWGFSCLVEVENVTRLLFDAGTKGGILLRNMKKLDIDPASIDEVFISHAHEDHTGGLSDFLKVNNNVKVYIPSTMHESIDAKEVVTVKKPLQIHKGIHSTGELSDVEQSLAVDTPKGLVVIVGCSHSGVGAILEAASRFGKVHALIGGLHGFDEFDLLKDLELICPTHCTQHSDKVISLYPEKCTSGGAGRIFEF